MTMMFLATAAEPVIPHHGLPHWMPHAIQGVMESLCLAIAAGLYATVPARSRERVAIGTMMLGMLMLLSCILRAYEFVEPGPATDAIFIGLVIGGAVIGITGLYFYRSARAGSPPRH